MTLDRYRLLAQLGAGDDGAAYRAREAEGDRRVVVCVLGGARADAVRWRALARRLRMAALLEHPAAVAVRALGLDDEPPYVVLDEPPAADLGAAPAREVPLGALAVAALGRDLAGAAAAAHRLGLVHGRLSPRIIAPTPARSARIDLTGVEAYGPAGHAPDSPVEASCRAPELSEGRTPDSAADVYALGAVLSWLFRGRSVLPAEPRPPADGPLQALLGRMLAADPVERPSAAEALRQFETLLASVGATTDRPAEEAPGALPAGATLLDRASPPDTAAAPRERLGRFRLLESLGQGGLGRVFRAEDLADGTVVAIKVLHPDLAGRPAALRRFRKEARLLADARSPYVANLIEMNEDGGVHYLAQEFVPGPNLGRLIAERGPLDESLALAIVSDVARALADAHRRGIVHRDVKPENILLADCRLQIADCQQNLQSAICNLQLPSLPTSAWPATSCSRRRSTSRGPGPWSARRSTPRRSSAAGRPGRPPAPTSTRWGPRCSTCWPAGRRSWRDSVLMVSRTCTPRSRRRRCGSSTRMSATVLSASREGAGQATPTPATPTPRPCCSTWNGCCAARPSATRRPPAAARLPTRSDVLQYDWTWELEAPPERLWPHVVQHRPPQPGGGHPGRGLHRRTPDPAGGARRFGAFREAGVANAWREHPFEWVEGRRLGVPARVQPRRLQMVRHRDRAEAARRRRHDPDSQVRIEPRSRAGPARGGDRGQRQGQARPWSASTAASTPTSAASWAGPRRSDPFEAPPALRRRGDGGAWRRLLDRLVELRRGPGRGREAGRIPAERRRRRRSPASGRWPWPRGSASTPTS